MPDDLREYFSSYGNVVEHQIMLDHKTMRSRGFGFVTFENEDAVEKIFEDGQMHELGGKQVSTYPILFLVSLSFRCQAKHTPDHVSG